MRRVYDDVSPKGSAWALRLTWACRVRRPTAAGTVFQEAFVEVKPSPISLYPEGESMLRRKQFAEGVCMRAAGAFPGTWGRPANSIKKQPGWVTRMPESGSPS
jgi:hypothetical protein